jgi:hypothetical protein
MSCEWMWVLMMRSRSRKVPRSLGNAWDQKFAMQAIAALPACAVHVLSVQSRHLCVTSHMLDAPWSEPEVTPS